MSDTLPQVDFNAPSSNPEAYINKAKRLVNDDFNNKFLDNPAQNPQVLKSTPDDFYVTWFAKVLGNWKAMISTDLLPGQYWEVTYNGAKDESYVDHYVKHSNVAYSDEGYNRRYPLG